MRTILSVAATLCLAAACGGADDADPRGAAQETAPSSAAAGEPIPGATDRPAPHVTSVPAPERTMVAGLLSPVGTSGVGGTVNVRGLERATEISLNVTGVPPVNRQLHAALVEGTCEQPGGEVATLAPIPVGAGNAAALTDTVPLPAGTVLDGRHALTVKGQYAGAATPPLACTPLPRWQPTPPSN